MYQHPGGLMNTAVADSPDLPPATPTRIPLERRSAMGLPYSAFVREYVAMNRPVVVEQAAHGCAALSRWTPEYFKQRFGSMPVHVDRGEPMAFDAFIDSVLASQENTPARYLHRLFIGPDLPELLPDLEPFNPYAFPRRLASPLMLRPWRRPDGYLKLLIGGVGGRFPVLHYDGENAHATITEFHGDKEFVLYPPEASPFMYPKPDMPNQSRVADIQHPDLECFPLFAQARQYHTVLHPGDMVFVPARWWHSARVLSPSISIGQNMIDASNWRGYVNELCPPEHGVRELKRQVKKAWLLGLGATLGTLEKLPSRQHPPTTWLGASITRLAPLSSTEAGDSRHWPVDDWKAR